jgi:hypothetical protein
LKLFRYPGGSCGDLLKPHTIADALPFPQSESTPLEQACLAENCQTCQNFLPANNSPAARKMPRQLGIGKISSRLLAESTITARLVKGSMATPNWVDPGNPKVSRVLIGLESVSTMEIEFPKVFEVKIAPVCGLMASEVGLIPTLTEVAPPVSGLNEEMTFEPLELL